MDRKRNILSSQCISTYEFCCSHSLNTYLLEQALVPYSMSVQHLPRQFSLKSFMDAEDYTMSALTPWLVWKFSSSWLRVSILFSLEKHQAAPMQFFAVYSFSIWTSLPKYSLEKLVIYNKCYIFTRKCSNSLLSIWIFSAPLHNEDEPELEHLI